MIEDVVFIAEGTAAVMLTIDILYNTIMPVGSRSREEVIAALTMRLVIMFFATALMWPIAIHNFVVIWNLRQRGSHGQAGTLGEFVEQVGDSLNGKMLLVACTLLIAGQIFIGALMLDLSQKYIMG